MGEQDHYGVLGVPPSATPEQIARAYRALVRRHHPDSRAAADGRAAPGDAEPDHDGALQHVMTAYATLHDPVRRAAYDRRRATSTPAARPTAGGDRDLRRTDAGWTRDDGAPGTGVWPRGTEIWPSGTDIWVGPVRREGDGAAMHPADERATPATLEALLRSLLRGWF
jgi:curved DNA-binding protein CbpA